MDRLAVFIHCREFAGKVPLHVAIHLPIRLFHGRRSSQESVRVSAGTARERNRKSVLEDRASGDYGSWRSREPDGYSWEATDDAPERFLRCVIFLKNSFYIGVKMFDYEVMTIYAFLRNSKSMLLRVFSGVLNCRTYQTPKPASKLYWLEMRGFDWTQLFSRSTRLLSELFGFLKLALVA